MRGDNSAKHPAIASFTCMRDAEEKERARFPLRKAPLDVTLVLAS